MKGEGMEGETEWVYEYVAASEYSTINECSMDLCIRWVVDNLLCEATTPSSPPTVT